MLGEGSRIDGKEFTGDVVPEGYIVMNDGLTIVRGSGAKGKGHYTPAGHTPPGMGKLEAKRQAKLSMQHGGLDASNYHYDDESYHSELVQEEEVYMMMMT